MCPFVHNTSSWVGRMPSRPWFFLLCHHAFLFGQQSSENDKEPDSKNETCFSAPTCIQQPFLTTRVGDCTIAGHLVGRRADDNRERVSNSITQWRFFLSFTLSLILRLSNGSSYIWNRVPNGLSRKPFPKFKTSQAVPDTLNQKPYTLMENMFFSL